MITIAEERLHRQHLVGKPLASAEAVVRLLGAVQAQDYAGAKWALGQRTRSATEGDVEAAIDRRAILRTHVLRPTWHFVLPEDIRWLLALTAPRVHQACAYQRRKSDLDDKTLGRSSALVARALERGNELTRNEVGLALADGGIAAQGPVLGHLMMYAELEGVICNGRRRGKQSTYALLDEVVPPTTASQPSRDEMLVRIAQRYFRGHGPALARDLAWWSGLTLGDTKKAIHLAGDQLESTTLGEKTYFRTANQPRPPFKRPRFHLLANFDEHVMAYADYAPTLDRSLIGDAKIYDSVLGKNALVLDGRIVGTWRRTLTATEVIVDALPFVKLAPAERAAMVEAAARLGRFLGLAPRITSA